MTAPGPAPANISLEKCTPTKIRANPTSTASVIAYSASRLPDRNRLTPTPNETAAWSLGNPLFVAYG